jgi:hypothetical protein
MEVPERMRVALADQSLGLKITNTVGTRTRTLIPAKYITDLDVVDDIMLTSDDAINSQKQLDSIEIMARKVGLKISRAKTEFVMVENWTSLIELRVSTGTINLVKNFKYLGSWLLSCAENFEIRKALAWKACIRLVKIWKSNSISCVESTLLYNATLTDILLRKLDGC